MLSSPAFPSEKRGLSKLRTRDFPPRKDGIPYRSPVRLTSRRSYYSPRVCTDSVRLAVRSYADVITKFSRLDGLPIFLKNGASLRASRAKAPLLKSRGAQVKLVKLACTSELSGELLKKVRSKLFAYTTNSRRFRAPWLRKQQQHTYVQD